MRSAKIPHPLKSLISYAAEGLRTLVFAMREITPEDYELIDRLMVDYQNAISDRDAKELSTFSAIESRLCCVGATGVEDRFVYPAKLTIIMIILYFY